MFYMVVAICLEFHLGPALLQGYGYFHILGYCNNNYLLE